VLCIIWEGIFMKRLNITVPDNVYHLLLTQVGKGKISSFLAKIARERLHENEVYLADCYREDDKENAELIDEWSCTEIEDWA